MWSFLAVWGLAVALSELHVSESVCTRSFHNGDNCGAQVKRKVYEGEGVVGAWTECRNQCVLKALTGIDRKQYNIHLVINVVGGSGNGYGHLARKWLKVANISHARREMYDGGDRDGCDHHRRGCRGHGTQMRWCAHGRVDPMDPYY